MTKKFKNTALFIYAKPGFYIKYPNGARIWAVIGDLNKNATLGAIRWYISMN